MEKEAPKPSPTSLPPPPPLVCFGLKELGEIEQDEVTFQNNQFLETFVLF